MSFSSVTTQEYKWYESLNAISYKYLTEREVKYLFENRKMHSLYLPDSSILKKWYEDFCNSHDEYQLNYFD